MKPVNESLRFNFPETSMISYLSGTSEGDTIEVCVVGNEGVVLLSDSTAFRAVVHSGQRVQPQ